MPVKKFKATTPSRRTMTVLDRSHLHPGRPVKALSRPVGNRAGRSNQGRRTIEARGGGHKRLLRVVDFRRDKDGIAGRVVRLEYDPNRSAHLALVQYLDGEKRYIVAPEGLQMGDQVVSGPEAEVRVGNSLPLERIPTGTVVHNVELYPGRGAQMARSAGAAVQLLAKEGNFAHLRLPSGEVRLVSLQCRATIGQVGNLEHENITIGKAGRARWMRRRPKVRGVARNPVDHPHGGAEGKAAIGRPSPVSRTGVPALGYRTRRNKATDRYILKRRKGRG